MQYTTVAGLFLLLSPTVFALAVRADGEDTSAIKVHYRWVQDGKQAIVALDQAGTLIGSECSSTLNTESFSSFPISVSVGNPPSSEGTISVGGKDYEFHSAPSDANHPKCTRAYNPAAVEVECSVPVTGGFKAAPATPVSNCFGESRPAGVGSISRLHHPDAPSTPFASNATLEPVKRAESTEAGCDTWRTTERIGDGNPHQNYFHKQLTENHNCGAASGCSVSVSDGQTWNFGFTTTFKLIEWISAGFNVARSYTTSASYGCNGKAHETVCVWYNAAHTAYTVRNMQRVCCGYPSCVEFPSNPIIVKSPNNGGVGGGYYCVVGTCRSKDQGYWQDDGRAGGP